MININGHNNKAANLFEAWSLVDLSPPNWIKIYPNPNQQIQIKTKIKVVIIFFNFYSAIWLTFFQNQRISICNNSIIIVFCQC